MGNDSSRKCRSIIGRKLQNFCYLAEQIPDIGYILNAKQVVWGWISSLKVLEAMLRYLCYVHISGNIHQAHGFPISKGKMDIKNFLLTLKKSGCDGCII